MEEASRKQPYPKYLYRAHTHGYPLEDDYRGFGSDMHSWIEQDGDYPVYVPIGNPVDDFDIEDLFDFLKDHLNKTQINEEQLRKGEDPFLSRLISLSSDFVWTVQRVCQDGKRSHCNQDQISGLALFETSDIQVN